MALIATTTRFSFRGTHSLITGARKEKRHGHQYYLEVTTAPRDQALAQNEVEVKILPELDRHDLTKLVTHSTGEWLVEWIYDRLQTTPLQGKILALALQETRKNRFVSGRSALSE